MLERTRLLAATALACLGLTAAAHAGPAVGVLGGSALFDFDTSAPGVSNLRSITGLMAGEVLYGVDYRPASGALYGLGTSGRLYVLDARTGAATVASTLSTGLSGSTFDIAFNPVVDRLRVVSDTGQNLRINVDTGAVTTDTPLAYAGGGATPGVTAAAYTNQTYGTVTSTVLYDIDARNGLLDTQAPPNDGTLNPVRPLGVTGLTSFDIDGLGNVAYAASNSSFYTIDLTSGSTGAAALVGGFGVANVTDFAITPVPEPMGLALFGVGLAGLAALRRRRPLAA